MSEIIRKPEATMAEWDPMRMMREMLRWDPFSEMAPMVAMPTPASDPTGVVQAQVIRGVAESGGKIVHRHVELFHDAPGDPVVFHDAGVVEAVAPRLPVGLRALVDGRCAQGKDDFRIRLRAQPLDDLAQIGLILFGRDGVLACLLVPLGVVNAAVEMDHIGNFRDGPFVEFREERGGIPSVGLGCHHPRFLREQFGDKGRVAFADRVTQQHHFRQRGGRVRLLCFLRKGGCGNG